MWAGFYAKKERRELPGFSKNPSRESLRTSSDWNRKQIPQSPASTWKTPFRFRTNNSLDFCTGQTPGRIIAVILCSAASYFFHLSLKFGVFFKKIQPQFLFGKTLVEENLNAALSWRPHWNPSRRLSGKAGASANPRAPGSLNPGSSAPGSKPALGQGQGKRGRPIRPFPARGFEDLGLRHCCL